jgi:creatinine amidohydrolase
MMSVEPSLVDLTRLPADRDEWPEGVAGEDPRDSSAAFGDELVETTLSLIGEKLDELGF